MSSKSQAAAANRFGLGAMPGELDRVGRDPRAWLKAQLDAPPDLAPFANLPSGLELLQRRAAVQAMRRADRKKGAGEDAQMASAASEVAPPRRRGRAGQQAARWGEVEDATPAALARDGLADIAARYRVATTTARPFAERLVRFWSNHFAVSADKNVARLQAAPMEREAIRPHLLGNFADMLLAVERHPAMLLYLDNVASVGDDSRMAQFAERRAAARLSGDKPPRKLGLNENLAREILELHTLGVDGGYAQNDVQELARAITGWGTPPLRELAEATTAYVFRAAAHEPGARTVLGKRYAEAGEAQGRTILRDLALHPATARHLSFKLARHFVADAPPPALVQRMSAAYLRSGGELRALYRAMIDDDAAWSDDARKFKTPDDFVVSALRAGGIGERIEPRTLTRLLNGLGQPVFTPRSPAGFPDTAGDWATGDALRKRVQAAAQLAERVRDARTPYAMANDALGEVADGDLGALLRRAGSPQEGVALLFSSPAFQWRV
ncbi:MAG: DUF1800 domain-containing protein [Lysobacter sp.]|nr:MAG: DUF1800 domain-containing protein [Lysobacter sp.]